MKIRYLSHACFEIKNEKALLIDPYFSDNPLAPKYKGKPLTITNFSFFRQFSNSF
jgi:L-ascorbate metabolism protein UlaG (beta-lactamase superfamily)